MSKRSALHQFVHAQIREAFGEPDHSLGRDDHWALRPGAKKANINILVNGSAETPTVWIFDPHSRTQGVFRAAIKKEDDMYKVLKQIEHRLQRAGAAGAEGAEGAAKR